MFALKRVINKKTIQTWHFVKKISNSQTIIYEFRSTYKYLKQSHKHISTTTTTKQLTTFAQRNHFNTQMARGIINVHKMCVSAKYTMSHREYCTCSLGLRE